MSYFSKEVSSGTHSGQKFGRKGEGVSYIDARKKVPECLSGLHSSEKELQKWHSIYQAYILVCQVGHYT
jgi:hypothetical protein